MSISNTLSERAKLLKVSGSLQLGIMAGLVNVGASGKYLKDANSSSKVTSVALCYEKQSSIDELPMEVLSSLDFPEVLKTVEATHVVVGITYGAKAVFNFQNKVKSSDDKQTISGSLEAAIKLVPVSVPVSIKASAEMKLTPKEKDIVDQASCKYEGDFDLKSLPTTFDDAIRVYKELPSLLGKNNEKAVPIEVWLQPLSHLNGTLQKVGQEIDESLANKCLKVIDEYSHFKIQVG